VGQFSVLKLTHFRDHLQIFQVMSENITAAIALNGELVTNQPLIKAMRVVKKETLKLISDWISRTHDHVMVLENFIPPFLDAVLLDYQRTAVPSAREPEVLSAIATIVNKLEMHITSEVRDEPQFVWCVVSSRTSR
jgi:exportin-1